LKYFFELLYILNLTFFQIFSNINYFVFKFKVSVGETTSYMYFFWTICKDIGDSDIPLQDSVSYHGCHLLQGERPDYGIIYLLVETGCEKVF